MTVDATHKNWGLTVFVDGESILSMETNCLSARDLSEMDHATIVMALDHLLTFLESHPASIGTPAPSKIEKAYGLLWRYMGSVKEVHEARNILLSMIDRDGQRRGVQYAKENTAPVSEAEILRLDDDPAPDPVKAAAMVLLNDDVALSRMAEAMHDGPLMANDFEFSVEKPTGAWCLDMVRAGLRALQGEAR